MCPDPQVWNLQDILNVFTLTIHKIPFLAKPDMLLHYAHFSHQEQLFSHNHWLSSLVHKLEAEICIQEVDWGLVSGGKLDWTKRAAEPWYALETKVLADNVGSSGAGMVQ